MKGLTLANPEYLYLLILLPLMAAWYIFRLNKWTPSLRISTGAAFSGGGKSIKVYLRHILFVLRALALGLLIVALARPQTSSSRKEIKTEGVDIVMALDVSTSMLAEDLKPNRIEAAKITALNFIEDRINDRIGLVVFAGESFTQCPITIDHDVLKNLISEVSTGKLTDGTAIGMGLATSVNRLKDVEAKSRIVILLTDGVNNTGFVAPLTAAEIAKREKVRVYTIGVGSRGMAPYPFKTPYGTQYQNIEVKIDEKVLREIAQITGGKYFRATSSKKLDEIYKEIDTMEKTKIDVAYYSRKTERFLPLVLAAAGLFLLEILLRYTVFRTFP